MCMGLGLPAELLTPQRSWFWAKTVFWWIVEASLTCSHTTPTPPTPWLPWQCTSRRTWSAWAGLCSLSPATPSSPSSGRTWRRAWSWWRGTTAATCATSSCTCSPPPRESNLSTTWCPWSVNVFIVFSLSRFRGHLILSKAHYSLKWIHFPGARFYTALDTCLQKTDQLEV